MMRRNFPIISTNVIVVIFHKKEEHLNLYNLILNQYYIITFVSYNLYDSQSGFRLSLCLYIHLSYSYYIHV